MRGAAQIRHLEQKFTVKIETKRRKPKLKQENHRGDRCECLWGDGRPWRLPRPQKVTEFSESSGCQDFEKLKL